MPHERAKELVELFDDFTGTYLRAEMEEALTLREEITPLLIEILSEARSDRVQAVQNAVTPDGVGYPAVLECLPIAEDSSGHGGLSDRYLCPLGGRHRRPVCGEISQDSW